MDPIDFLRRPEVICRLFSILFSIIVFGCIADKGKVSNDKVGIDDYCVYDGDSGACNYGIAIGVIAFIACIIFLVLDFALDSIQNVEAKKYIFLSDLLFSGVWSFLWFVGFCYLCDKWRKQDDKSEYFSSHEKSNAEGAIAFTFFSILSWGVQTFLAFRRVNQGASNFEFGGRSREPYESSPYSSFPDQQNDESYQAQPFQQSGQTDQSGEYRPPTY